MKKTLWVTLGVLAAGGAGVWYFLRKKTPEKAASQAAPLTDPGAPAGGFNAKGSTVPAAPDREYIPSFAIHAKTLEPASMAPGFRNPFISQNGWGNLLYGGGVAAPAAAGERTATPPSTTTGVPWKCPDGSIC